MIYSFEQILQHIELKFEEKDTHALNEFFDEWNTSITPNSIEFINQNDTIKAVYDIFKEVYKPIELQKIKNITNYLAEIRESRFKVVQNSIDYFVMKSDDELINMKRNSLWQNGKFMGYSIKNFRPPLNFNHKDILYLTDEYNRALDSFFTKSVIDNSDNNREGKYQNLDERIGFLKNNMPVLQWNFYETFPKVIHIIFDKHLTFAKVEYITSYRGETLYLYKEINGWVKKDVVDSYNWD